MPSTSSKRLAVAPIGSSPSDSSLAVAGNHPTIGIGPTTINHVPSQASVPRLSKPMLPSIAPAYALTFSSFLPSTSYSGISPSTVNPTGSLSQNSPGLPVNTSISASSRNQTGQILSTKRSGSPIGLPPRLPTTDDEQIPVALVPQSSSSEDIQSGLRNNRAIDFVPKGANSHTKQASTSSNQRNQRHKIQDKSILSNSLSSLSVTSSPTIPPLSNQRSFSESTTFPSQLPSEKIGMVQEVVRDDANNDADQKPVHWPKQAPTVHWITSEEGSNPLQSLDSTGNVVTAGSLKL